MDTQSTSASPFNELKTVVIRFAGDSGDGMKNGKWRTVKLGELADFRNGVNYNKSSFQTFRTSSCLTRSKDYKTGVTTANEMYVFG